MHITMVKKIGAAGVACLQCRVAENALKSQGLWDQIDQVAVADENDFQSEGFLLAAHHGVTSAPFFIMRNELGGERVIRDYRQLLAHHLHSPSLQPVVLQVESPIPESI